MVDEKRFEDFANRTDKALDHISARVDKLWDFRLLLIGGSVVISAICSTLISVAYIYFGIH